MRVLRLLSLCLLLFGHLLIEETVAAPAKGRDLRDSRDAISRSKERKAKDTKKEAKKSEDEQEKEESLFLPETADNQSHVVELYRCPDCGYEQDEPGTCPDHDEQQLVQVLSQGKSPFEPAEVDGNEDLLVDLPLSGLQFKAAPASGTAPVTGGTPPSETGAPRSPPEKK